MQADSNDLVKLIGDLRLIATSSLSGTIELRSVLEKPNVYGLGMTGPLDGEILIINSVAYKSHFDSARRYHVCEGFCNGDVSFLAHTQVINWKIVQVPVEITTFKSLEEFIELAASIIGFDTSKSVVPFRITACVTALRWFVVGGVGNGQPNPRESFLRARYLGGLDNNEIEGVGIFSKNHHGIATNLVSNIHLHFITKSTSTPTFVGHLDDDVILVPGTVNIYLPEL